jgi:hypothetical protein
MGFHTSAASRASCQLEVDRGYVQANVQEGERADVEREGRGSCSERVSF